MTKHDGVFDLCNMSVLKHFWLEERLDQRWLFLSLTLFDRLLASVVFTSTYNKHDRLSLQSQLLQSDLTA